jgi:hypothetical protein
MELEGEDEMDEEGEGYVENQCTEAEDLSQLREEWVF